VTQITVTIWAIEQEYDSLEATQMGVELSGITTVPKTVVLKLNEIGAGPSGMAQILEAAITQMLDSSPAERFAMMSAALPMMQESGADLKFAGVRGELIKQFVDYCGQKRLRPDVLLTGALLIELGVAAIPDDPDLPTHCGR
jgi:hypothetical protein